MPGRSSTRARCTSAGAVTTTTASTRLSPPVSNSSGISSTTTGAPSRFRLGQEPLLGVLHQRMHDRFEPLERRRVAHDTRAPSLSRSTLPPAVVPGKRRLDERHRLAFIEPVHGRIGVVHRHALLREKRAVVDLPIPIEPVRPRMNMVPHLSAQRASCTQRTGAAGIKQRQQRQPENGRMVALDALEQLDAEAFELIAADAGGHGAPAASR